MFNKFVHHSLYTEYHLFNKTGCKFTTTNVYFKKENYLILNGTLWKEVENKFMPRASLAKITKNPPPPGRAGRARPPASLRLPAPGSLSIILDKLRAQKCDLEHPGRLVVEVALGNMARALDLLRRHPEQASPRLMPPTPASASETAKARD